MRVEARDGSAVLTPDGHQHHAWQPCNNTCEPDPRLRCRCLGVWNDPTFRDQCHLRATGEDMVCDDCRMCDVPLGADLAPIRLREEGTDG